MDAQLAQKVSQLAYALKASGGASDNKEAYDMALDMLKKKDTDNNAVTINSGTNNNSRTNGIFLGKDSVGFELKGKTLKELAAEDAAKGQQ
ncbi:hypothetical protein HYV82_00045 [Candidatus Woesearchaeota archaeon]|nr:hypothetical protein [Candidatus Woesearchaeota archaeon]